MRKLSIPRPRRSGQWPSAQLIHDAVVAGYIHHISRRHHDERDRAYRRRQPVPVVAPVRG